MAGANDMAALAQLASTFFKSLMDKGFTREEAAQLVGAWLNGYCTR